MEIKRIIFDYIQENIKNPRFYALLIALVILILLIFPYIDANVFYFNRVEKRIDILEKADAVGKDGFSNPILQAEYDSILEEISRQEKGSIGNILIIHGSSIEKNIKFVTGALIPIIFAFVCIFAIKGIKNKILGVILFLLIGGIAGFIARIIPTIINPIINYIAFPVLFLVLIIILALEYGKKEKQKA